MTPPMTDIHAAWDKVDAAQTFINGYQKYTFFVFFLVAMSIIANTVLRTERGEPEERRAVVVQNLKLLAVVGVLFLAVTSWVLEPKRFGLDSDPRFDTVAEYRAHACKLTRERIVFSDDADSARDAMRIHTARECPADRLESLASVKEALREADDVESVRPNR